MTGLRASEAFLPVVVCVCVSVAATSSGKSPDNNDVVQSSQEVAAAACRSPSSIPLVCGWWVVGGNIISAVGPRGRYDTITTCDMSGSCFRTDNGRLSIGKKKWTV